jgi:RNA polymerase sigma-70 factor (ECF subfamily)
MRLAFRRLIPIRLLFKIAATAASCKGLLFRSEFTTLYRNLFLPNTVILSDGSDGRNSAEYRLKALRQEADERLLVEAAQRDPRRFGELYELNFHRVYAYVSRRVHNREEAEDITSDVFHHALAKLKQFEWRGTPFVAWLFRIAANALADRWEAVNRESKDVAPDELADIEVHNIEQRAALFQLVETLPADQRHVVVMRFVEQKSIKEIAQEIHRTEGAVKQLQFRALEKLREHMEGADA